MRTKRGVVRKRRTKRLLKAASGYSGGRGKLMRSARETLRRAWWYGRRHRREKKGEFRRLWITRISAATRMRGMSYSRFVAGLKNANVELNRKVLADLALTDEQAFDRLVEMAREPR
ncbi:MAG: 50S ribosomal protein L20 [Candidatus Brocadiaceae bacterium]|nr:50S ribosomal protein L20 [Candidatus Brocadiaceae bacterium]